MTFNLAFVYPAIFVWLSSFYVFTLVDYLSLLMKKASYAAQVVLVVLKALLLLLILKLHMPSLVHFWLVFAGVVIIWLFVAPQIARGLYTRMEKDTLGFYRFMAYVLTVTGVLTSALVGFTAIQFKTATLPFFWNSAVGGILFLLPAHFFMFAIILLVLSHMLSKELKAVPRVLKITGAFLVVGLWYSLTLYTLKIFGYVGQIRASVLTSTGIDHTQVLGALLSVSNLQILPVTQMARAFHYTIAHTLLTVGLVSHIKLLWKAGNRSQKAH